MLVAHRLAADLRRRARRSMARSSELSCRSQSTRAMFWVWRNRDGLSPGRGGGPSRRLAEQRFVGPSRSCSRLTEGEASDAVWRNRGGARRGARGGLSIATEQGLGVVEVVGARQSGVRGCFFYFGIVGVVLAERLRRRTSRAWRSRGSAARVPLLADASGELPRRGGVSGWSRAQELPLEVLLVGGPDCSAQRNLPSGRLDAPPGGGARPSRLVASGRLVIAGAGGSRIPSDLIPPVVFPAHRARGIEALPGRTRRPIATLRPPSILL